MSTTRRALLRIDQRGFTIPGTLVALAVSLIVSAAFASFHHFQLVTFKTEANRIDLHTLGRSILDVVTAEIRQAGANPTCDDNIETIADAKQFRLRIQADTNGDGSLTLPGEDVTYEYRFSSEKLERASAGTTDALVEGVDLTGSRIRYFDGAGTELTAGDTGLPAGQRDQVRRVRVELVLQEPEGAGGNTQPLRVALASDVELRNRYFGNVVACP